MTNRRRQAKAEAGFTMIELLISIVVLMVGVLAVAQLVPRAVQTNFRNRNSSTALVWAQKTLEEMVAQPIDSEVLTPCTCTGPQCTGQVAPAGHYAFCDSQGDGIGLGRISTLNDDEVLADGCPLDATGTGLDFSPSAPACDLGYSLTRDIVWDVNTGALQPVEIRWRVVAWHRRTGVRRRMYIVGARVGIPGQGSVVRNLMTVVGR